MGVHVLYRLKSLFYRSLNELPFWDFRLLLEKPPAALIEIAHDNLYMQSTTHNDGIAVNELNSSGAPNGNFRKISVSEQLL